MSKPYYVDYVNHMFRFYARYPERVKDGFETSVDNLNWLIIDKALVGLSEVERNAIIEVYKRRDTLPDNVYKVSKELKIEQSVIWTIISKISKKIAKERDLI